MSEWVKYDPTTRHLEVRKELLIPKTPFRNGECARKSWDIGNKWDPFRFVELWDEEFDQDFDEEGNDLSGQKYYIDFDWEGSEVEEED
ncbi:MAG: hypothetical protein M1812_005645 [Candelaria pacifica]|nr:MAG: hypothetical protein M1812_005645 [Candelaria pacifica]